MNIALRKGWIIVCGIVIFLFGVRDIQVQIMVFQSAHRFLGFPFFVHCLIFFTALAFLHFHNSKFISAAHVAVILYCVIFPAGFLITLIAHKAFSLPYAVGFVAALGTAVIEERRSPQKVPVSTYVSNKATEYMPIADYAKIMLFWAIDPNVSEAFFQNCPDLDREKYETPIKLLQMFSVDMYAQTKDSLSYIIISGLLINSLEAKTKEQYDALVAQIPVVNALATRTRSNPTEQTDAFARTVGKAFSDSCVSLGLCRNGDSGLEAKGAAFYQTCISACAGTFDHVVVTHGN